MSPYPHPVAVRGEGPEKEALVSALTLLGCTISDDEKASLCFFVADEESAATPTRSPQRTVWFGARPPDQAVALWLPTIPSASMLAAVLAEFGVARELAVPGPSWRRKSDAILGRSESTRALLAKLDQLAAVSAPVLITGESGTGKELVARTLHYCGPRANAPFIAINCAAIPEALFEGELFGHERGAFTGAQMARAGSIEAADGGTLFLDEIGELPRSMQSKLLRVLETKQVTRLGSTKPKDVNVRIVSATNVDLATAVTAGRFREDMFFRLSVFPVPLAALRERVEDIPAIAHHHLSLIADREHRTVPRMEPDALRKLQSHRWPGNVRELVNTLERAFLACDGHTITVEAIELPRPDATQTYREARADFERSYYRGLLARSGNNISAVARAAGKTRKEVYDALKRLQIQREEEDVTNTQSSS